MKHLLMLNRDLEREFKAPPRAAREAAFLSGAGSAA
jgi:hypothetical protein